MVIVFINNRVTIRGYDKFKNRTTDRFCKNQNQNQKTELESNMFGSGLSCISAKSNRTEPNQIIAYMIYDSNITSLFKILFS